MKFKKGKFFWAAVGSHTSRGWEVEFMPVKIIYVSAQDSVTVEKPDGKKVRVRKQDIIKPWSEDPKLEFILRRTID